MSDVTWYVERLSSHGGSEVFVDNAGSSTYHDLVLKARELVVQFRQWGIGEGSKVAVIGDFDLQSTAAVLALAQLKATTIPFSSGSMIGMERALAVCGCDFLLREQGGVFEHESLEVEADHRLFDELTARNAPGLLLFSSGTTGIPKGILHDFTRVVERFRKPGRSFRAIPMLMFDHFGGYNTILGLMSSGSTIVSVDDRTVDTVCAAIERHRVELLPATPSFLALLLASHAQNRYDLSSLRRITYGTELMPESLLKRISSAFPDVPLQQTYGLSEVGVLSSKSESNDSTWVRVGGRGYDTKIVDGILWIKSNYSMLGYIGTEDEGADEGNWFCTQDRVEVKGEYVRFLGRSSDIINVGGQKVMPGEVEGCLLEIPEIVAARVTAKPHALLGQVVCAEVVIDPAAGKIDRREIRRFCRQRMPSFKVPQHIEVLDEIPLSKRLKKAMRDA